MAEKGDFGHLPLPLVMVGKPKFSGRRDADERTKQNKENRSGHGTYIKRRSSDLSRFWKDRQEDRIKEKLPEIKTGIPILLEIDPEADIGFLKGLGFEIISELEEGYIIVSTGDIEFAMLNEKADDFIANISSRCNTPAKIYEFLTDDNRLKKILGKNLLKNWSKIEDDKVYDVDISISCSGDIHSLPEKPVKEDNETAEHYQGRLSSWEKRRNDAYIKWDEIKYEREVKFENIITAYNGSIGSYIDGETNITEFPDSFSTRITINGKGLKDIAHNFSWIYEMELVEEIELEKSFDFLPCEDSFKVDIISPEPNDPVIAVIDSGIQEGHKYLQPGIISEDSICLVKGKTTVNDEVSSGGHGTRVAGAILYPYFIPRNGTYKLPCWIRNIRVLDEENEFKLPMSIFPPIMIKKIVQRFNIDNERKTKIFNHSIATIGPAEIKHMSTWASEIDRQSYERDILFIQSAGNIDFERIKQYYSDGIEYPKYLFEDSSRIGNPAQSFQALTVGSISHIDYQTEDTVALGQKNEPSAFSRSGPGIWDIVKPDVVEYGGNIVKNRNGSDIFLTTPSQVCPELIRISPEGPAYSKDVIGTSFSTPKVSYIAAEIQKIFPDSPSLLYRALIAQSARWPMALNQITKTNVEDILRFIGYGIPDAKRATENNDYRITLVTTELMEISAEQAHVFKVPIPEELNSVGEDYDILIEITLSYAANPRNTRRTTKRYLSTWLDWRCSKLGESMDSFKERIFITEKTVNDNGNLDWFIGERSNWGKSKNFSRSNGTLQKDWAIIKSNQLENDFCIAVRGHKGWDINSVAKYSLAVSFEAINQDIEIYEPIRTMIEVEVEAVEQEITLKDSY